MQLGELELLLPPPPSSAAVVAFALKFLAGYGPSADSPQGRQYYGAGPAQDGGIGMHRLVCGRVAWGRLLQGSVVLTQRR